MARVTVTEVTIILPHGHNLIGAQIEAAINSATCIVDEIAANCGSHLSVVCLKNIELYLSAHFAAVSDYSLTVKSESDPCSGGKAVYGFDLGQGIMGTPFGQMANTLSSGCVAAFDAPPVGMFSIGADDEFI